MRRIIVNREVEREVYLHTVLEDLLWQINARFDELTTNGPSPGWKSEAINGTIILAMLNEGWMNAVGQKAIAGWDPDENAKDRLRKVRKVFLKDMHFSKRPLQSVDEVREIRNEFAHAKPLIERRVDTGVVIDASDHSTFFDELSHPVERQITIDSYRRFREDSKIFRHLLLERSGLKYFDIKTKAHESSKFIGEAD